jgi:hypothetical protein
MAGVRPHPPDPGQLADRPVDAVDVAELPRPAAVEFADRLVLRERRRVEFQDLAKKRPRLTVVFLPVSDGALVPRHLWGGSCMGSLPSGVTPPAVPPARGHFCRMSAATVGGPAALFQGLDRPLSDLTSLSTPYPNESPAMRGFRPIAGAGFEPATFGL